MVANRPFTVTATIEPTKPDGVIVGHGGHRCGWALYLKGGHLAFATRRDEAMSVVTSTKPLPKGKVQIQAQLAKGGVVTFQANGADLGASGKLPGLVFDMPDEPLGVGSDPRSNVGDYSEESNAFSGVIEALHIDLAK
jgi:hypothetical protein